jgi:hypothetical protein
MDQPTPRVGDTFCGLCDGCRFWPVALTAYLRQGAPDQLDWLCALCARTPDGPGRRTVCFVGNAVLAALHSR